MPRIGECLLRRKFITEDNLWDLLEEQKSDKELLGQLAIKLGLIDNQQLILALEDNLRMSSIDLNSTNIPANALKLVSSSIATTYKIVPVSFDGEAITIAMANPQNLEIIDDISKFTGYKIKGLISNPYDVENAISRYYAEKQETLEDLINEMHPDEDQKGSGYDLSSESSSVDPIKRFVNLVLLLAIKDQASDIHFEPFEEEFRIRCKIDGSLIELVPPPFHLSRPIVSRIKVMANLDIAETRLPQDGRIELNVGGNRVELRVSTLPTMFGESIVIRVLDRTVVQLSLQKIGMDSNTLQKFRETIHTPNGIVLVTGPTGSGKTTTLYSALNELNTDDVKIITTEDPIEYDIDGIIQVPINTSIQVTFAAALRAILRHDPDIILIGEIRDYETAEMAIQSAMTGHLVFSTLHTNDAPSAITRLRDMGIPSFLITATLQAILAQRIVRKICVPCREQFMPSDEMFMELNLPVDIAKKYKYYYGKGCRNCSSSGYKGRSGIYELMNVDDSVKDLISSDASVDDIRKFARSQGMTTLRESGLKLIFDGITTIEEVVKETVFEDDE